MALQNAEEATATRNGMLAHPQTGYAIASAVKVVANIGEYGLDRQVP